MAAPVKSAFQPMQPKINAGLQAKLPVASPHSPPQSRVSTTVQSPRKAPAPSGAPISIAVELWIETINDPAKSSPAFAYVLQQKSLSDPQRLVVVINASLWPAAAAVSRADSNALRWLVSLALTDRCLCWTTHPILNAITRYLALAALGRYKDFERGLWLAYALRDHELTERIPELLSNGKIGPQQFAGFTVEVDSAKLDFWREKMARRTRSAKAVGAGRNVPEVAGKIS
jgi:hypothetical protein